MDNSLKTKEKTPDKRGANAPPAKSKTKPFLIGRELKTKDLLHTAAERASVIGNKTQPKTRIKTPGSPHAERRVKPLARLLRVCRA